jgi:hypothetical protein
VNPLALAILLAWLAFHFMHVATADTNITTQSEIRSTPYVGSSIDFLVDGKLADPSDNSLVLAAPLPVRIGSVMPVQYEFRFARKMPITRIRFYQHAREGRQAATGYAIELDTNGVGRFDKVAVVENKGRADAWMEHRLPAPINAFGLRFRTTAFTTLSEGPNYGGAAIGEFEIYADVAPAPNKSKARLRSANVIEIPGTRKPLSATTVKPWRKQFQRGLVGSMWQFWSAGSGYSERANAANLALLKRMRVNRYWLNAGVFVENNPSLPYLTLPRNAEYRYFVDRQMEHRRKSGSNDIKILPFPSEVVAGYKENVLAQFVAQMHKNNIGVIVNEFPLPFGLGGWDFPRVANAKEYPCILSSAFVRDASTTLYREFMNAGADGLALGGDEFFFHSHDAANEQAASICVASNGMTKAICKPTCRDLYERQTGIAYDALENSLSFTARWKTFEYRQLATLFAGYATMMKSINSNAIVTSLFRSGEENRPAYGVAYDVMGTSGLVDEMSSNPYWTGDSHLGHYFFANETKKLIGASRSRTALVTLQPTPNFDRRGYKNPIMVYGPAFSALMHGVSGINFYEQDYLFKGDRNDAGPWIEKFFNFTAALEDRGLAEFQVPKSVALLYSRASEDWWQLSHKQDPVKAASVILCQNAVMEVLFKNAIPFDLYYLDQPATLSGIRDYALAIMPCPYSMATTALPVIREAIAQGVKIISLGNRGEVNEFGVRYDVPLLDQINGIRHLPIGLTGTNYRALSQRILPTLLSELGDRRPLKFDAGDADVECSVRVKGTSRWIFCLNWEQHPVGVELGLRLGQGDYRLSTIDLETSGEALLKGKSNLAASDLARFHIMLAPSEAKIFMVEPVNKNPIGRLSTLQ